MNEIYQSEKLDSKAVRTAGFESSQVGTSFTAWVTSANFARGYFFSFPAQKIPGPVTHEARKARDSLLRNWCCGKWARSDNSWLVGLPEIGELSSSLGQ